jgi:predicted  nucleic acid-binding Zn-ribbon protein
VKKLQDERQRVDNEAERVLADTQALDQRILALGSVSAAATVTLERQTAAMEQKAVLLQREIDALKAKLAAIESASATFGPKVDSYKAKYLR